MNKEDLYKFCPLCGEKINKALFENRTYLLCPACDFEFFLNPTPCVSAIIIKDNKILLAKRAKDPYKDLWEIPGGFVENKETLEEAIKREMREELRISLTDLKYYDSKPSIYTYKGMNNETFIAYFKVTFDDEVVINSEILEYNYFHLDNLPEISFPAHKEILEGLKRANKNN